VLPAAVDEKDAVKDLDGLMGIHRRTDLGDCAQVAINEFAETPAVFHSPLARASPYIKLEARYAEGVLCIDKEEADSEGVLRRRSDRVLFCPLLGFDGPLLIRHAPDFPDSRRVVMDGNRKLFLTQRRHVLPVRNGEV